MSAIDLLESHTEMARRKETSLAQLAKVRANFLNNPSDSYEKVTIFSAGSLGRLEAGENSDLDIFVVADHEIGRLNEIRLLSKIADLNDNCGFPPFSDEMRYMKIYDGKKLIENTGKPRDDSENSFTTRMLLLLEGTCLVNDSLYQSLTEEVCRNYFRDNKGKKDFRPLFLINDLLRYWRTLCLNYEGCRDDASKPWRKKNMNLRFSRLTTVFATVAILMVYRPTKAEDFIGYTKEIPLRRLAMAVDGMNNSELVVGFGCLLDHYATFLRIKDNKNPERLLMKGDIQQNIKKSADDVAGFFVALFNDSSLKDYSRYLFL